ncbi:hypothetical protein BPAE_0150g00210 [Botrytis paeoniae]|uniref:Uncharacterized protein n=1 Tax=Botrytis paeoniae TaxID=278948 RepID=A0A4Z1FMR5_9HELO|nr:hypothetical protein BPAE_0150g00210 [Botrytis paeoniae]
MPVDSKTQKHSKQSGDAKAGVDKKANISKGSRDERASRSTNSSATIPRSSKAQWDDGVKTMRRVQKKDDADDRKADGVQGVIAYAAKYGTDPKKQK